MPAARFISRSQMMPGAAQIAGARGYSFSAAASGWEKLKAVTWAVTLAEGPLGEWRPYSCQPESLRDIYFDVTWRKGIVPLSVHHRQAEGVGA